MNSNNGSGFHKTANWLLGAIPGFALFICWVALLSTGEFIDGIQGTNCQARTDLITSPQSVWNKAGCVINGVRQVIPSRNGNSNNTAP